MSKLNAYKQLILDLFPLGRAWPRGQGSQLNKISCGVAEEQTRLDDLSEEALRQIDPRLANELLVDWERLLGLPDECTPSGQTFGERKLQAHQKLVSTGGQSAAYFTQVAENLGFEVEITDVFQRFEAGDKAGERLYGENWVHWWGVTSEASVVRLFRAGQSSAGDPLRFVSNSALECTINKLKPAQSKVLFTLTA